MKQQKCAIKILESTPEKLVLEIPKGGALLSNEAQHGQISQNDDGTWRFEGFTFCPSNA